MYYSICDDVKIRNYKLKGNKTILIRILEPTYKHNNIPYTINNIDQYIDILELYISDTVDRQTISNDRFNYENAKILNDFILNNDFDEIVVHCSLGISRSPAIMICIAKILNNQELENIVKEKYRFYNNFIVDVFENYNYFIKSIENNIEIKGNILYKKNNDDIQNVFVKILK